MVSFPQLEPFNESLVSVTDACSVPLDPRRRPACHDSSRHNKMQAQPLSNAERLQRGHPDMTRKSSECCDTTRSRSISGAVLQRTSTSPRSLNSQPVGASAATAIKAALLRCLARCCLLIGMRLRTKSSRFDAWPWSCALPQRSPWSG